LSVDQSEKATDDDSEIAGLRKRVVTQARELAVMRWEFASLLRQHPISSGAANLKYSVAHRFPAYAHKFWQLRREFRNWWSLRRSAARAFISHPAPTRHRPVLLIGDAQIAQRISISVPSAGIVTVSSGAGFTRSLPVPQIDEPPLRTPADGSFVRWLIEDSGRLRRVAMIIVDAGDEVSLGILRGRLVEGQTLALVTSTSSPAARFATDLGRPEIEKAGVSYYTRLPSAWLDPLDDTRKPVEAIVTRQSWPKVSVVMVSFNQAAFLEEGIRSILEQGYPNTEFIVIDGNSTDGSVDILNSYRECLSHLVIEPDHGQSDGLNKGFARATGEILTWVNSDDLLEPGALFRAAQAFTGYGVDMIAGGCRQIGRSRNQIILNHHNRLPFGLPVTLPLGLLLDLDRFWLTGSFFYQPEVFFGRAIWNRSGGKIRTDLNYVLDYDLWVRMAAAGATIVHIPDFLACSRTHDQQKTTVGMPQMPEVQLLLREYSKRLLVFPN
jgi:Glycosyl transferase family 2